MLFAKLATAPTSSSEKNLSFASLKVRKHPNFKQRSIRSPATVPVLFVRLGISSALTHTHRSSHQQGPEKPTVGSLDAIVAKR